MIPDRADAIRHALSEQVGDVVVIAGKGHGDYQITGQAPAVQRSGRGARGIRSRLVMRDLLARGVTGGTLHGANSVFGRVASDARSVRGTCSSPCAASDPTRDFVADVAARGASGALVNRLVSVHIAQVVVPEVLAGLTAFTRAWRGFPGAVVGITGSNGKTTVKEMTGAILRRREGCLVTRGNLNNHIGVPLTLAARVRASLCRDRDGRESPGEIAHLARVAAPGVDLVINAGPRTWRVSAVSTRSPRAKGELFESR